MLLELFTSQGCWSCPPADRLLTRLARTGVDGIPVVPLAFHVDYWNHIGWRDPFSSRQWSERQRGYAEAFRLDTIYTPQLVVDGRYQVVGSRDRDVREAIARAAQERQRARMWLAVQASQSDVTVHVRAQVVESLPPGPVAAWVALFETGLVTEVSAGENRGSTLRNDHIVRVLQPVMAVETAPGQQTEGHITMPLDPAWRRHRLGVAAFLQQEGSGVVFATEVVRGIPDGSAEPSPGHSGSG